MAPPRPVAMTMVLAIVTGCGGAPVTASAPEPACAEPGEQWVHIPMFVRVGPSGEIDETEERHVLQMAALVRDRQDLVAARLEGFPGCEGTSIEEAAAAAERVARRLEEAGVPPGRLSTVGYGDWRCGLCPCALPLEKGRHKKCSERCSPDRPRRRGDARVELSVRACT